jgi:hypothetical protein
LNLTLKKAWLLFTEKHRDEIKEIESAKAREIRDLKDENAASEKTLKDRITRLEATNRSLENVS